MTALIKNRLNYNLMDFISTIERNPKRARIEILMFAMSRYNFSKDHHYTTYGKTTIIYDDTMEIIFSKNIK